MNAILSIIRLTCSKCNSLKATIILLMGMTTDYNYIICKKRNFSSENYLYSALISFKKSLGSEASHL
jgi:hypothetical protein